MRRLRRLEAIVNHNICPIAQAAAWAARNWNRVGPYAARRYAERRGVPMGILTLARVLAAAEAAGL